MKDVARTLILEPKAYGFQLQPDHEFNQGGFNSDDYEHAVTRNVEALLKRGAYLVDTKKDNEVYWHLS